ncbi:MAG TPA: O-antigen ligase family protein [Thermoanaerobaculia bacterium]|nr:O-antigen ligase family protein [Thermoanaerobaculia bacterium]
MRAVASRKPPPAVEVPSTALRWLTPVIAAGALLVPLVMSMSGEEVFRYPKELFLRLEVVVVAVLLLSLALLGRLDLPRISLRQKWVAITVLICGWTVLTALVSTNRFVSIPPTVRVLEYALLFVVTVLIVRDRALPFAGLLVAPAIVNAVIYLLQELDVWSPFDVSTAVEKHLGRTALLGNPNDVGSYLVAPALVATALSMTHRRYRLLWAAAAVLLIVATFATQTVGAIGALIAALFVMFALWRRSWGWTLAALVSIVVLTGIAFTAYKPLHDRAALMRDAFEKRDYEILSASRTLPTLAGLEMARDHPLFGVGPGCFAYEFFDYKLRVQQQHRWLYGSHVTQYNFGEAHNDHLQVLSETGLVGYALFATAIVLLAAGSRRPRQTAEGSGRAELVRLLSLPVAASLAVLAIAQFPLELVAPTSAYLWTAAVLCAWRES